MRMVADYLNRIGMVGSTIQKKSILAEALQSDIKEVFAALLMFAVDPRYTFGVRSTTLPPLQTGDRGLDAEEFAHLLLRLSEREVKGDAARTLVAAFLNGGKEDQVLTALAILDRDLRVGVSTKNINAVYPDLIYEVPIMLAKAESDLDKLVFPALASTKKNGVRMVIQKTSQDELTVTTRAGHHIEMFPAVQRMLQNLGVDALLEITSQYVLDGEGITPGENLQDSMSILRKLEDPAMEFTFCPFDCIELAEWGSTSAKRQLRNRMQDLGAVCRHINATPVPGKVITNLEEGEVVFKAVKAGGGEGLVCKTLHSVYEPRRSVAWVKWKGMDYEDAQILEVIEGNGKYTGMAGALLVEMDNGVTCKASLASTVEERSEIWKTRTTFVGQYGHFQMLGKTRSGSAQNMVYRGLRGDK